MEREVRSLFWLLLVSMAVGLLATSCNKKDAEPQEDPYALEDELVRLDAYRQVHYPEAKVLSEQAFCQELKPGAGVKPAEKQWVRFDYSAQTLDARNVAATNKDTAKFYSHFSRSSRYAPVYRACTPYALGREIFDVVENMQEGATVALGISSLVMQKLGLTSERGHTSSLLYLTLREVVPDPKEREKTLMDQYVAVNPGFEERQRNDTAYYYRQVSPGVGAKIGQSGRVFVRYAAYSLDGFLFDTNDAHLAQVSGQDLEKKSKALLLIKLGDQKTMVKAFSGIFQGLSVGDTFELVVPSSLAYEAKGKGYVQPYEPLRFWVYIQNYLE